MRVAMMLRVVFIMTCLLSHVHGRRLNFVTDFVWSGFFEHFSSTETVLSSNEGSDTVKLPTSSQPPQPPATPTACSCPDPSVVSLHHPETGAFVCSGVLVSRAVVITFGGCLEEDNDEGETMLPDVKVCGCEQEGWWLKTTQRGSGEDSLGVLDDDSAVAVLLLNKLIPDSDDFVSKVPWDSYAWNNFFNASECEVVSWGQTPSEIFAIDGSTSLVQDQQAARLQSTCIIGYNGDRECFESLQPSIPFPEGPLDAAVVCGGDLLGLAHSGDHSSSADHQYGTLRVTSLEPLRSLIYSLVSQAPALVPDPYDAGPPSEASISSGSAAPSAYWFGRR